MQHVNFGRFKDNNRDRVHNNKAADLLVLRFLRIDYGYFLTAFSEKESH